MRLNRTASVLSIIAITGIFLPIAIAATNSKSAKEAKTHESSNLVPFCGSQSWFDLTPRRIGLTCGAAFPLLPITHADVNGDGIIEQFQINGPIVGFEIVTSGQPCYTTPPIPAQGVALPNPIITCQLSAVNGEVQVSTATITDFPASFGDSLIQFLPSPGYPTNDYTAYRLILSEVGWFDCDNDGDLDLVLRVDSQYRYHFNNGGDRWSCSWQGVEGALGSQVIWLENIGHEKAPNAADLDGNGSVDAGDIAIVLLNFSSG
jgi:hypothetical protein